MGYQKVEKLKNVDGIRVKKYPKVSIIFTALNEERNIEKALSSLLEQDYSNFEIIAVNDRSTDRTGIILDKLSKKDSNLKVIHNKNLPTGWLGKNHALQLGADHASGEILLFTDADILMKKDVLLKSIIYFQNNKLDHLVITPEVKVPGFILPIFSASFIIYLSIYAKPWLAKKQKSRRFIGVGAFNMVKKSVYESIGKHEKIKLRPDDDLKLGKIIKRGGFKQNMLFGRGMLEVEWYSSVKELMNGLRKNTFSAVEYYTAIQLILVIPQLLLNVFPFFALCFTTGWTLVFNLITVLILMAAFALASKSANTKMYYGTFFPFVSLFFIFIQLRSMILALKNNGIDWRGTFYSLQELRQNRFV
ncbi:MAG: glycosyltransferase family 2 protein [Melioribacteraceae bacterium]|nr:glycosyltransferase family 2 protein [Melioribacteraceae bacterium]